MYAYVLSSSRNVSQQGLCQAGQRRCVGAMRSASDANSRSTKRPTSRQRILILVRSERLPNHKKGGSAPDIYFTSEFAHGFL